MIPMYFILGAIAWVIFAFLPAIWARRKGYNFFLFLLLALVVSWVLTLVIVLFLEDKTQTPESVAADKAVDEVMEKEQQSN